MKNFQEYYSVYTEGIKLKDIDIDSINEFDKHLLGDQVISFLQDEGESCHMNGLMWVVNPLEFTEWLNQILYFEDRAIPFARSAFGDFLFMRQTNIYVLNTSLGKIDIMTDDLSEFINSYLTDKWFLETYFNSDLFEQMEDKHLEKDECFGFYTLLNEGGKRNVQNIERKNLHTYIDSIKKSDIKITFFDH